MQFWGFFMTNNVFLFLEIGDANKIIMDLALASSAFLHLDVRILIYKNFSQSPKLILSLR